MHQCVKCNTFYNDGDNQILKGCTKCGGRFFFFVRKEHMERAKTVTANLKPEDKEHMEQDVRDIMGDKYEDVPVVLDLASVNILEPGKFELDLVRLFKGDPLVYKLEEGKYIIDVAATFQNQRKQKE